MRELILKAIPYALAAIAVLLVAACEGMGSFGAPAERTESRTQQEEEQPVEPPKAPMEASDYFDPSGGSLGFRNCTLAFPRNSIREKTYFTIRAIEENTDDKIALKATSYSIMPSGHMFRLPAVLSIRYDADALIGFKADDLTLVRLIDGVWREVGKSKVDLDKQTVSVPITTTGTFALAQREVSRRKVNDAPQAQFDVAYIPLDDGKMRVEYDASKSADGDGYIVKYDWDFDGDGIFDFSSRESFTASYVFDVTGKYTTVLKVTDNGISPKSAVATGVVEVDELFPPSAPKKLDLNITTFPPSGNVPVAVNFAASAVGGLDPYIILWDFGKGRTAEVFNPAFRFENPGNHKVFVYASDQSGQEVAREITLNIKEKTAPKFDGKPFRLSMLASREKGRAPLGVDFTLKFENAKEPVRWKFEYGDEEGGAKPAIGSGKSASHTYTQPGTYIASIIATDSNQNVDTTFLLITVDATDTRIDSPKVKIVAADRFAAREGRVTAAAYPSEQDATEFVFGLHGLPDDERSFVSWNFGDGHHSTEFEPVHKYDSAGIYEVIATYGAGIEQKERKIWLPAGDAPAAAIQLPQSVMALAPYTVTPKALSAGVEGTPSYEWDFGDGGASSEYNPIHTYTSPGTYALKVKVSDAKGEKSVDSAPVTIEVFPQAAEYEKNLALIRDAETQTGKKTKRLFIASASGEGSFELPVSFDESSSPFLEMSPGGGYVAYAAGAGFAVTDIKTGLPVFEFKPRNGKVVRAFVTRFGEDIFFNVRRDSGAALAYLNSAHFGLIGLTPEGRNAEVTSVSADGNSILIRHWTGEGEDSEVSVSKRSLDNAGWSKPEIAASKALDAVAGGDGSVILVYHNDRSVYEISPRLDEPGQVTGSGAMKKFLSISDDSDTAAWLEDAGGGFWNIMIARRTSLGFLAIENLSEALVLKASAVSLLPSGDAVVFFANKPPKSDGDNADINGAKEGIFICDLSAESYKAIFLFDAYETFATGIRSTRN